MTEDYLPSTSTPILTISHRGAHADLPENSLPAFERALELGADAIELDVHATRDGEVVVHHDFTVQTEGTAPRMLVDLTAGELREFPLSGGVRIPTLREVLDAIGVRASVFVEVKARDIEPLVVRCIRESDAECAVHSFDHRIIQNIRKIFPAIRTGVLQVARPVNPVAAVLAAGAEDLWQHVDYIDEELVNAAHAVGARVIAWTANDPSRWKPLAQVGVDGLCTDLTGELAALSAQLR